MGHCSQQLSEKSSGATSDIDDGLESVEGARGKNSTGALDGPGGHRLVKISLIPRTSEP